MTETEEHIVQQPTPPAERSHRTIGKGIYALLLGVLLVGIFLRLPDSLFLDTPQFLRSLHPAPGFTVIGFDEGLYREYVNSLSRVGLANYPAIVDRYIEIQKTLPGSVLPPLRFLYIFVAYLWHSVFGVEALPALHDVASFFNILTLLLATLFAWRLKGPEFGLGVGALMAFAPTQIHMSQHALVDGFFAFWALLSLWLLWENLRAEKVKVALLLSYLVSLALLVLTKENAFFVWVAIIAILGTNRWLGFGVVRREIVLATFLGPLLGAVIMICLAGGLGTLLETYQLSVGKNYHLKYAILTGDGPWHRYLVDLLLVSPIILILAIGATFRVNRSQSAELLMIVFVAASFLVMCNLKYGMNLRYANMWDMPLRFLALSQLVSWMDRTQRYRTTLLAFAVGAICVYEMRQYLILFVQFPLYELVTEGLVRALHILK